MWPDHLDLLICPSCLGSLDLQTETLDELGRVERGSLACQGCHQRYPIVRGVPRFVPEATYSDNFGLQWNLYRETQLDNATGAAISASRFAEATRWPARLEGELILEAGGGAGRFSVHAAATGATVCSLDLSTAVDANHASHGHLRNLLIVQADLFAMPFRRGAFHRVYCFGVLQHTPDVRAAFLALPPMLRPGGWLAVDVYLRSFARTVLHPKYLVRRVTRTMPPERVHAFARRWVDTLWPVARHVSRIPRVGPSINSRLLIPDYRGLGVPEDQLQDWARLDLFDMLAPRYDQPQTLATLRAWFREAGMEQVDVHRGHNGIEGRGVQPGAPPLPLA